VDANLHRWKKQVSWSMISLPRKNSWRHLIHQGKHLINIAHFSNTNVHSSRQALKTPSYISSTSLKVEIAQKSNQSKGGLLFSVLLIHVPVKR
jgi:hypothetical protein